MRNPIIAIIGVRVKRIFWERGRLARTFLAGTPRKKSTRREHKRAKATQRAASVGGTPPKLAGFMRVRVFVVTRKFRYATLPAFFGLCNLTIAALKFFPPGLHRSFWWDKILGDGDVSLPSFYNLV
jgi:hypothetical protein